jgi:hypothetical protein
MPSGSRSCEPERQMISRLDLPAHRGRSPRSRPAARRDGGLRQAVFGIVRTEQVDLHIKVGAIARSHSQAARLPMRRHPQRPQSADYKNLENCMKTALCKALACTAIALSGTAALAQDAASAPVRGVGVSASTASRAEAKAASASYTGTLVRTGPTATRDAKHAVRHVEGSASSATHHHANHAHRAASAASE